MQSKRNKRMLAVLIFVIALPMFTCGDRTKRERSPIWWHRRQPKSITLIEVVR